jgi:hypothetical protein
MDEARPKAHGNARRTAGLPVRLHMLSDCLLRFMFGDFTLR